MEAVFCLSSGQKWRRDLLLNQSRLICTDSIENATSLPIQMVWQLGPGWTIEKEADGIAQVYRAVLASTSLKA